MQMKDRLGRVVALSITLLSLCACGGTSPSTVRQSPDPHALTTSGVLHVEESIITTAHMTGCAVDSIFVPRPIPAYTPAEEISCQQGTVIVYWSGQDQAAGVKAAEPHQHGHRLSDRTSSSTARTGQRARPSRRAWAACSTKGV